MNRTTSRTLVALATVAALGTVGATGAQAAYEQAKFKAEIKGVQTHKGEYHHASNDRCDPTIDSVTTETVRFKSTKKVQLTATKLPGQKNPILTSGRKPLKFPTKARVTRDHSHSATQVPADCGDNGGGVPPGPGPDCGTKIVSPWNLDVEYFKKDLIEVQPVDNNLGTDLFERCGSGMFPYLVTGETFGRSQPPELSAKDLFDEKIGKLITIGRGELALPFPEGEDNTNLRWELSLTRIKPDKG